MANTTTTYGWGGGIEETDRIYTHTPTHTHTHTHLYTTDTHSYTHTYIQTHTYTNRSGRRNWGDDQGEAEVPSMQQDMQGRAGRGEVGGGRRQHTHTMGWMVEPFIREEFSVNEKGELVKVGPWMGWGIGGLGMDWNRMCRLDKLEGWGW